MQQKDLSISSSTNVHNTIIWIDRVVLFCLSVLIFILPVAHTATIRSFALFMPAVLIAVRYYIAKDFTWVKTSFELPFFVFFIAAVVSLLTSVDIHESLKEIWGELLVPILLFYTVYFAVKKEIDTLLLLNVLFFGSLIFSIYSFYDFQMHEGKWFSPSYRAGGLRDPGGGEVAGLYHSMVIPFIFWGLFYFKEYRYRIALSLLLVFNLLALHITFTRAAYFALGFQALLTIGLLAIEKKWLWSLIILISVLLVSFVYTENRMFREMHTYKTPSLREYMALTPEEIAVRYPTGGMGHRLAMWKTAIEKISENPFYSHGYGRFLFGKTVRTDKNTHFIYKQVHNTFIGITFEIGIQGLIIFLWMIGTFFFVCWKYWRNNEDALSHYFSASLLTMMIGYWVNNFFGSFDGDDSKLLFMMLLGIGMAVMHRLPKEKELLNQK